MRKWLLLWSNFLAAQPDAYYALWNLTLQPTQDTLTAWGWWYRSRVAFFRAVFPQTSQEIEDFPAIASLCEAHLTQLAGTDPFLADIYGQRAIYYGGRQRWWQAAYYAWQSWRHAHRSSPTHPLSQTWKGLWEILFATLPAPYRNWLWIQPETRVQRGLEYLRRQALPPAEAAIEKAFLYFMVARMLELPVESWLDTCQTIHFSQTSPPYLWQFMLALQAWEEGKSYAAESLLLRLTHMPQIRRFPYPYYWLGKLYLYQGRLAEAERSWQAFVVRQVHPFGKVAQYAWRGYIAWLQGNSDEARQLWRLAIALPFSLWEEDGIARELAHQWLRWPPDDTEQRLWAGRWLAQFHRFTLAQDTLAPLLNRSLTPIQRLLLFYTLGRLYHRQDSFSQAKQAYWKALQGYSTPFRSSTQAYAAFYLAQLYEQEARLDSAKQYYTLALRYAEAAHRLGIARKARFALLRLGSSLR
ncbi:MAG: hypothetical protein NZ580_03365 [Bacteroidia bacterium]|nr:hypothetical protein [Bacteroidia bacterium]MDW8235882.1 hypothetical protein [Bacteroidia bacterium]